MAPTKQSAASEPAEVPTKGMFIECVYFTRILGKMLKSFLPIMVVFGIRYLPFDEEQNLLVGRALFAFKIIMTLVVAGLVFIKIKSATYKATDVVKEHEAGGVVVPAMGFAEYDITQLMSFLKSQVVPTLITLGIHYKFNFVQPLYIQTVMALIAIYDWNLFQIYMLKNDGSQDKSLRRPFQSASAPGFMESMNKKMQEAQEVTDKKAN